MARYTYTFSASGTPADVSSPFVQWWAANHLDEAFGVAFGATDSDAGAIYVADMGPDQFGQTKAGFAGPGDGSKYVYGFLRTSPAPDARTSGSGYWFWSDGGSDGQILKYTTGFGSLVNIKTYNGFTFALNDVIGWRMVGGTIAITKNGVVDSNFTVTDPTPLPTGYPGLGVYGLGGPALGDWTCGDVDQATRVVVPQQSVIRASYW